jgi:hypothetical protein
LALITHKPVERNWLPTSTVQLFPPVKPWKVTVGHALPNEIVLLTEELVVEKEIQGRITSVGCWIPLRFESVPNPMLTTYPLAGFDPGAG